VKYLKLILTAFVLLGWQSANALVIQPSDCDGIAPDLTCTTGIETDVPSILAALGGVTEVYKQDVGGGESGVLAGSYTTAFLNSPSDPMDAVITYTGGDLVDCSSDCGLLIKDGNSYLKTGLPNWYYFNLTGLWDGMEVLELTGFWPSNGAISHVSLIGGISVPEPTVSLLLGAGLIMIGLVRRKV
jgi:hypothetical protein